MRHHYRKVKSHQVGQTTQNALHFSTMNSMQTWEIAILKIRMRRLKHSGSCGSSGNNNNKIKWSCFISLQGVVRRRWAKVQCERSQDGFNFIWREHLRWLNLWQISVEHGCPLFDFLQYIIDVRAPDVTTGHYACTKKCWFKLNRGFTPRTLCPI